MSVIEPDYQRWLANYRAKRAAGGGQSKGDSIRDIGKTETDDEVAEWERAVTYNEAILRQKPASASDTAGCRCRKSLRCYRMVNDDGRRGKQSSNGLANEPTKVGEQHPLDAVGEIKQRWVQRNEERPQEKSKDGGNILTSAGPDRQTGRNEQTQKPPPSEFQQLATLDSSEDRLTHREKQVTQQQATAKASESDDSERQRDALNRKPGSTTQDEYEGNDDSGKLFRFGIFFSSVLASCMQAHILTTDVPRNEFGYSNRRLLPTMRGIYTTRIQVFLRF
jgi:hypothetical protein